MLLNLAEILSYIGSHCITRCGVLNKNRERHLILCGDAQVSDKKCFSFYYRMGSAPYVVAIYLAYPTRIMFFRIRKVEKQKYATSN